MTLIILFCSFIWRYFGCDHKKKKKLNPQWLEFREGAGQIAKELL